MVPHLRPAPGRGEHGGRARALGVGVGYDFDHHNGLSLNYDYNKGDLFNADVTAQTLTLGYEYRF